MTTHDTYPLPAATGRASTASRSPLSIADASFRLLVTGPRPLSVHRSELHPHTVAASPQPSARAGTGQTEPGHTGVGLGGVGSAEWIALDRLREMLRRPDTTVEVKNAAWSVLVARSQRHGGAWTLGAVGVALPRLVRLAAALATGQSGGHDGGAGRGVRLGREARVELDAEVLAGFLSGLAAANPARRGLFPLLIRAAHRAALDWLRRQRGADAAASAGQRGSIPPPPPAGHPDLVLARAVAAGVITAADAALIGTTRFEDLCVTTLAARSGRSAAALWKQRRRAEYLLAAWLREFTPQPDALGPDPTPTTALHDITVPDVAMRGIAVAARSRPGARCPDSARSRPSYRCGPTSPPAPAPPVSPDGVGEPTTAATTPGPGHSRAGQIDPKAA